MTFAEIQAADPRTPAAEQFGGADNQLTYLVPAAIGAFVGGRIAGPIGAVAGAAAGVYLSVRRLFNNFS